MNVSPTFAWFVIHKETRYVVAGFADISDAETFVKAFKHTAYRIVSSFDL